MSELRHVLAFLLERESGGGETGLLMLLVQRALDHAKALVGAAQQQVGRFLLDSHNMTSLLALCPELPPPATAIFSELHQIRLDIPRTQWWLEGEDQNQQLERLLMAYILHSNTEYVQSMNFTGALILSLASGDETGALRIATTLWSDALGPYYSPHGGFDLLIKDTRVVASQLSALDCELACHLDSCGLDLLFLTPNYWLTVFLLVASPDVSAKALEGLLRNKHQARGFLIAVTLKALIDRRVMLLCCSGLEDMFVVLRSLDAFGCDLFVDVPDLDIYSNDELDLKHRRAQVWEECADAATISRASSSSTTTTDENSGGSLANTPWTRYFYSSSSQRKAAMG
jgi:hypothetical protein